MEGSIIITRGLPGSGKTTWARKLLAEFPKTYKIVCKDDLRDMLDAGVWSKINEKHVLAVRDELVKHYVRAGFTVIVADTNLNPIHIDHFREMSVELGCRAVVQDFTDVSLEDCIRQDLLRARSVGERVIRDQYNRWLRKAPVPVEFNPDLPLAIICDIDGTVALHAPGRNAFDHSQIPTDIPNKTLLKIMSAVVESFEWSRQGKEVKVLFVSGRDGSAREATLAWMSEHNILFNGELWMRPAGDNRKDSIIKEEIYRANIEGKYNVLVVFDDRNQVVDLWRSLGLPCYQVNFGDF